MTKVSDSDGSATTFGGSPFFTIFQPKNNSISNMSSVYYPDYLQLDKILGAQAPESRKAGNEAHDEMLFIVIHQAYELWFKQVLHEVGSVIDMFADENVDDNGGELNIAVHRLERVKTILDLLVKQMDVMETMTPLDFLDFRDLLRPASGFQSMQFKILEARLGLRMEARFGKQYYTSQLTPAHKAEIDALEGGWNACRSYKRSIGMEKMEHSSMRWKPFT